MNREEHNSSSFLNGNESLDLTIIMAPQKSRPGTYPDVENNMMKSEAKQSLKGFRY